jgi:hypothetical protein
MRLHTVLLATAVAVLAAGNDMVAADKCTVKTTAPTTSTTTAPVASTTSSYVSDASTAASAVDASQATTSDLDGIGCRHRVRHGGAGDHDLHFHYCLGCHFDGSFGVVDRFQRCDSHFHIDCGICFGELWFLQHTPCAHHGG